LLVFPSCPFIITFSTLLIPAELIRVS